MPVSRRDVLAQGLVTISFALCAQEALGQANTIVVTGRKPGGYALGAPRLGLVSNSAYPPQIDVDLDESYVVGDSLQLQGAATSSFVDPTVDVTIVLDATMASAHRAMVAALGRIAAPAQTIFRARGMRDGEPASAWSRPIRHGDTVPPVILSPATANFRENAPVTHMLNADKDVEWTILPGTDASRVELYDGDTIRLLGNRNPDFEDKQTYALTVKATDLAGNIAVQSLLIRITDVDELSPSTWGTAIKSPYVTLANGNLTVAAMIANVGAGCRVRATNARKGRKYFEVHVDAKSHDKNYVGLCSSLVNIAGEYDAVGSDPSDGACLAGNGLVHHNGKFDAAPDLAFSKGDMIMVAFDTATKMIWFGRNGTWHGSPVAGTGGFSMGTTADFYAFAAVCPILAGPNSLTANFGATAFKYPKPRGFSEYI